MPETNIHSGNTVTQWSDGLFLEFVREDPLKKITGTSPDSCIYVHEDLEARPGTTASIPLATRLTGDGQVDGATLVGQEEQVLNYPMTVEVHELRNAVVIGKYEKIKSAFDLFKAAKGLLKSWWMEKDRDLKIARLLSPVTDGTTLYASATEAQKDAWVAQNNPTTANKRILFGAAKGNETTGDHSTSLGNIDGTADDLHQDGVRLAKRMAQNCEPHIRPAKLNGDAGREGFFQLVGSLPFRDLASNMDAVLQNADSRGDENQIFGGGTLKVNNVIVMELPELDRTPANGGVLLENVGDGGTTEVEATFLMGAQALAWVWAQRPEIIMDDTDYKNKRGVAIEGVRGCRKSTFNLYQHGVVTSYVSAVGD